MMRKRITPTYGMKKMARSQAIAAVGRRLRGTTMIAMMRMVMSTSVRNARTHHGHGIIRLTPDVSHSAVAERGVWTQRSRCHRRRPQARLRRRSEDGSRGARGQTTRCALFCFDSRVHLALGAI